MKKSILTILVLILSVLSVQAKPTEQQVRSFFDEYVNAVNTYQHNIFSKYYIPNATIYRVVEKKDGTKQQVQVPMSIYQNESKKGETLAKVVRYTNSYVNIKVVPLSKDYKIEAIRKPSMGGSYPAYFVIGEDSQGNLKIKIESMNTPRQEFLQKQ